MTYITSSISKITAFLILHLYNFLASYGIKSMLITIAALAVFSRLLMFIIKEAGNILTKFIKNPIISKVTKGISIAVAILIGIGVYLTMRDIGTYIPELKNSIFLTMTPMKLYSQDKTKLIYYIGFILIEVSYFLISSFVIPKILKTKSNLKSTLFSFYVTCSICAGGIILPIGILIYWAMTSIINLSLTLIKILIRKLRGKPLATPQNSTSNKGSLEERLTKILENAYKKRDELTPKKNEDNEIIEVEEEPRVNLDNNQNFDKN